jgi:hypothetical protein
LSPERYPQAKQHLEVREVVAGLARLSDVAELVAVEWRQALHRLQSSESGSGDGDFGADQQEIGQLQRYFRPESHTLDSFRQREEFSQRSHDQVCFGGGGGGVGFEFRVGAGVSQEKLYCSRGGSAGESLLEVFSFFFKTFEIGCSKWMMDVYQ